MSLKREFLNVLDAYLTADTPLGDVLYWLAQHVQMVADSNDDELQEITGEAWLRISEYDADLRDEESVRELLSRMVRSTEGASTATPATPTSEPLARATHRTP